MVSATVLAAVGGPIVIILIILFILVMIARSAISKLKADLNDIKDHINDMKVNVDINSEAVDLMIPWIEAAQETFQISGFGAY